MSKVLLVHAKGGPPLGHVLSRTAARAEVHLLALSALPPSVAGSARRMCASVVTPAEAQRSDLVSLIVTQARAVGADAVLTCSEYAVVAVAEACEELGLAGAGDAAALARDKRLMRRTWHEHGLPQPEFRPVATEADLHAAAGSLPFPLLLKAAWSAGSTAHQIIRSPHEVSAAWCRSREVMAESAQLGYAELHVAEADADFVVEQIVTGTASDWFDEPGWGDYVSVEGVVADGVFHPVCLSGRMPTVEPFTERAGITPAQLSPDAQDRVVALAREAVDALGLRDCGTHTEIKLGAGGRMWLIETAARFGGAMTVPQIEEVFGLDLVGMLVDHLLGRPVEWPEQARTPAQARGAAGSLVVLAVDGRGEAWQDRKVWDFPAVTKAVPLSRGSVLSVVAESSLPDGGLVPVYDPAAGANTMAALCLLSAADPRTVLRDFETLVHALPEVLPGAGPELRTEARPEAEAPAEAPAEALPEPAVLPAARPTAPPTARPTTPAQAGLPTAAELFHGGVEPVTDRTVVGENLSLPLFRTLSGVLAGHPYLKVVVDRAEHTWHLLDTAAHPFHVNYLATRVLGMELDALDADLDAFNASVYMDPERRFLLGVLSLHTDEDAAGRERTFLVLETTEADTMNGELLAFFYEFVRVRVDGRLPLLLKPANHGQEEELAAISEQQVPRILSHELFGSSTRTPLNPGEATGRLRYFRTHEEYAAAQAGLGWSDIVAMPCLPDDVPRVAGFLNTAPITPLSHTNVLASGWGIPNAIVRDLAQLVEKDGGLDGAWVRYRVCEAEISLERLAEEPALRAPAWHQQRIRLEPPLLEDAPVLSLHRLRSADRDRYGTKAANLGELHHVLDSRSADLTAYYGRPRPPRDDLYGHLATRLHLHEPSRAELRSHASDFVAETVGAPTGVALPFSLQQRFLASSPALQQGIGKLKMALELDATDVLDSLCLQLQQLIRHTPVPESVIRRISQACPLPATARGRLVVRSSSNAEDLPGFSAAGVYDSVTTVRSTGELLDAVRQVWASLVSPRSVRLRHQVGISLDDTYMGVIIQDYVPASLGGVLVTCNPTRREDFRNVYLNCSPGSPEQVVEGSILPQQYLYNTVEGGGRTVALGSWDEALSAATRGRLADLSLTGRLLQSHFSGPAIGGADLDRPLDIEWLMTERGDFRLVQIRPYAL